MKLALPPNSPAVLAEALAECVAHYELSFLAKVWALRVCAPDKELALIETRRSVWAERRKRFTDELVKARKITAAYNFRLDDHDEDTHATRKH